jgi:hypothetical protein
MATITIDSATSAQLGMLTAPVVVLDPSGGKLGEFVPMIEPSSREIARLLEDCPHTAAELDALSKEARENPGAGRPLAEIWKSLGRT